jgi:hypothetical protein
MFFERNTTEKQQSDKSVAIEIYPTGKRALYVLIGSFFFVFVLKLAL